jgi:hypothetical protein
MARPPETMIFADVSSGRSLFATSSPTKLERRGPHRDDLLGVFRFHGLDRIAGIDRPLEGV